MPPLPRTRRPTAAYLSHMRPFIFLALAAATSLAQPGQPDPTPPLPPVEPGQPRELPLDKFPPQMRAGVRTELARRQLPIIPTLVIVSSPADYLAALAGWSVKARYPILIDDGSVESREDIARFARGFKPESVVRWSAPAKPDDPALTPDRIKALSYAAIAAAWDFKPADDSAALTPLIQHWVDNLGLFPVGIVAADANDPAWPAAAALAAGHGQPICWLDISPGLRVGPSGLLQTTDIDPFEIHIRKFAEATNLPWRDFGDAIDAVSLCLNIPSRIQIPGAKPYDMMTLSYRFGRTGQPPAYTESRWASASQIFGNQSQSAYRAMSSLFLQPRSAWLFDGYDNKTPFNEWDATKAAAYFEKAEFTFTLTDTPMSSDGVWRALAARPIPAGIVMVNSQGEKDEFVLQPGRLRTADTPFPAEPSIVYFVHSWSATLPADRPTIAARWLERGAYAYFGSAQEPYLQSFVTTPDVAGRLLSSIPWATATRYDQPINQVPVWKLTCIGDPLLTLGPPAPRTKAPLPLQGAKPLADDVGPALKAGKYAEAISTLALLARDEDAAKLAAALINDKPDQFTPEVAAAALMPLFRTGRSEQLFRAYDTAFTGKIRPDDAWKDAIWLAAYPQLGTSRDRLMLESLKNAVRPDNLERDMDELAYAWARAISKDSALGMLENVAINLPTADAKSRAATIVQKFRSQWQ
ncbi:MAG: hypothetical protein IT436_02535 [Phycisphaerales bacterium]|nr:hypothetical protein [Phycisphaerales bacterium]